MSFSPSFSLKTVVEQKNRVVPITMKNQITKTAHAWCKFLEIASFYSNVRASAQIIPDNTLPNNSQVEIKENITKIEGYKQ